MAVAESALPKRLDAPLGGKDPGVWRAAVFQKKQCPIRFEDAPHLGEHASERSHRAERIGGDHGVEFRLIERQAFAYGVEHLDLHRQGAGGGARAGAHDRSGLDADHGGNATWDVKREVRSCADPQFQDPTAGLRHDVAALFGDEGLSATTADDARRDHLIPEESRHGVDVHGWGGRMQGDSSLHLDGGDTNLFHWGALLKDAFGGRRRIT